MKGEGIRSTARRIQLKQESEKAAAYRATCTKEIDEAHATINKNQDEYDKQLLTLSSGYLLLSLAFIKDIVHTDEADHRWMLYASFVTLSICILGVLASFQISNEGHYRAKSYWENQRDGDKQEKFPYEFADRIKHWNWFTGCVFFIGIVLSMSFVITNLRKEAAMSNERRTQDGQHINVPARPNTEERGANMKVPSQQPSVPKPAVQTTSNTTKK